MSSTLVPQHLGDLHAYETVLLVLLAFGPFVVLAVVVALVRRRDLAEEAREAHEAEGRDQRPEVAQGGEERPAAHDEQARVHDEQARVHDEQAGADDERAPSGSARGADRPV